MTPADQATFITLWQQGLSHEAMAQQLSIPVGTVKSRAHRLQKLGMIQPRGRGGRPMLAWRAGTPQVSLDTPWVSRRVSTNIPRRSSRVSPDTPPVQYLPPNQGEMLPLLYAFYRSCAT